MDVMRKAERKGNLSLHPMAFEEAVAALVREDTPTRTDSQAEESCSTKLDDPESASSETQTSERPTPSADSA